MVGLVHAVVSAIVWSLFSWLLQSTKKAETEHDTKQIEITIQEGEPKHEKEEEPKEHKEEEHKDIIEHVGGNLKSMNYASPL